MDILDLNLEASLQTLVRVSRLCRPIGRALPPEERRRASVIEAHRLRRKNQTSLLAALLFIQEGVQHLLVESEICISQPIKGTRQIEDLSL